MSVITVAYLSASAFIDTVESVLVQSHENLEYLIFDGGSTDDTLGRLKPYRDRIDCLLNLTKKIYAAMKKEIARLMVS